MLMFPDYKSYICMIDFDIYDIFPRDFDLIRFPKMMEIFSRAKEKVFHVFEKI